MGLLKILGISSNAKFDLEKGKNLEIFIPYPVDNLGKTIDPKLKVKNLEDGKIKRVILVNEHLKKRYAKLSDYKGTFIIESIYNREDNKGEMIKLERKNIPKSYRNYNGKIIIFKRKETNNFSRK